MSNISKKQIEELNKVMDELRTYLDSTSAPEPILRCLELIEDEINDRRYGLIFEDHIEEIEEKLMNNDTELEEIGELHIDKGRRVNHLIEGENLAVMTHMERDYRGKIDVICVDPPYNTGMDSLNYNDHNYVEQEDSYIHSKWLSFMKKRIDIAYRLLTEEGVMFINIDEHEIGTLLLLASELFDEKNLDVLIWPKTDPRFDQKRVEKPFHNIKMVHEYVLVCFKDKVKARFNKILTPVFTDGEWIDTPQEMETILKGLGTTSSAKDELDEIFGSRYMFQTPKPRRLTKEFIRAASKRDSIVLDFFAGSGTTGHAVMDLNREDDGERTFVLVTNNENGICREIAYERLKKAIEDEEYQESIQYLVLKLLPRSEGDQQTEGEV